MTNEDIVKEVLSGSIIYFGDLSYAKKLRYLTFISKIFGGIDAPREEINKVASNKDITSISLRKRDGDVFLGTKKVTMFHDGSLESVLDFDYWKANELNGRVLCLDFLEILIEFNKLKENKESLEYLNKNLYRIKHNRKIKEAYDDAIQQDNLQEGH